MNLTKRLPCRLPGTLQRTLQRTLLGALGALTLAGTVCAASDKQSHDHNEQRTAGLGSHVHGEATLNIGQDGDQLLIEFESPAMNLIGFEHEPQTDSQKDSLARANQLLRKMDSLLQVNTEAACRQTDFTLTSPFSGEGHDEEHDDHDKDHANHHDNAESDEHSEFAASYKLQCSHSGMLTHFTLTAFGNFPATTTIDVQWATEQGQGAAETTAGKNVIQLPSK